MTDADVITYMTTPCCPGAFTAMTVALLNRPPPPEPGKPRARRLTKRTRRPKAKKEANQ